MLSVVATIFKVKMIREIWKILGFNGSVEMFLNSQHFVIVKNHNNCICKLFYEFFLKTVYGSASNPNLETGINVNVDVNAKHYVDRVT